MGESTGIAWCDMTWNPWRGCTKVDRGCTNCYAEVMSKRNPATLGVWGVNGSRAVGVESYWRLPLKWNRETDRMTATHRPRVFCGSLMDWLEDRPELIPLRARLLATIAATPNLDWLLLSKRPEGWADRIKEILTTAWSEQGEGGWSRQATVAAASWRSGTPPPNVWMLTSVNDQASADLRIPQLLQIPARVHGVSYEPATGPVDFRPWVTDPCDCMVPEFEGAGQHAPRCKTFLVPWGLDWVIVGGESGPHARPFDVAWARSTIAQCRSAGVACFVKQLGAFPFRVEPGDKDFYGHPEEADRDEPIRLKNKKGGDMAEWSEDLRVREFPS